MKVEFGYDNNLKRKIHTIVDIHIFPVLGDSEQIFSCNYYLEKLNIKYGSIDDKDMQKEIVDIMEGGPEAFERRKDIYICWNH